MSRPGHENLFIYTDPSHKTESPYYPWTHKPVCTDFLKTVGDQLCVFTDSNFANERGISIFTTPKIAEQFASLPPYQTPSSLQKINKFSKTWYASSLPGKGIGLLASKPLQRGDLITAYTPLFLAHPEQSLNSRTREFFFRKAVDQLPEESRNSYLNLTTIFGDPSVIAQDVLKANTFEMQVGGFMHFALFPETSRINHGCGPK